MQFGSLFAGIGGIDLGFERAGMECIWQVEIDDYCQKILAKHWPDVSRYRDIKQITILPQVDLIVGGFPCQAFSTASHGIIVAEDLWPEMLRIVSIMRPVWVVAENVTRRAIEMAEREVKNLGYKTGVRRIGAYEIGADHRRNRWWLIAHTYDESKLYCPLNAETSFLPEVRDDIWGWESFTHRCRMAHGFSSRMDKFRVLGNAVVPQVAEWLGRKIMETG